MEKRLHIKRLPLLRRLCCLLAAALAAGLLALPAAAQAPCKLVSSKVRTGLLIAGALAYFLFAASQEFHGVYPYHGIWARALTP